MTSSTTAFLVGVAVGAGAAYYLHSRRKRSRRDPVHPHLPAMASPKVQRERIEDLTRQLGDRRRALAHMS